MLRKIQIKTFLSIAYITAMCFQPMSQALAEDTEIYFPGNSSSSTATKPNILFMLDLSGSMGRTDTGETGTRLVRMQDAMRSILKTDDLNINAGIGTFNTDTAAIRFPVKDLSGVDVSITESTVIRAIDTQNDDAQQITNVISGAGIVGDKDFTNTTLFLNQKLSQTTTTSLCAGTLRTFTKRLSSNNHDAEEMTNGSRSGNSYARDNKDDLDLGTSTELSSRRFADGAERIAATRFTNINIPQKACIKSVEINLTSTGSTGGSSSIGVAVENTNNATGYSNSGDREISGRAYFPQFTWAAPDKGYREVATLSDPNLQAHIQSIINMNTWTPNNDINVKFARLSGNARRYYSYDGSSSRAAQIVIQYYEGGSSTVTTGSADMETALRFNNIDIPQGATITSAELKVRSKNSSSTKINATITADYSADSAAFTNTIGSFVRTKTAQNINWLDISSWAQNEEIVVSGLDRIVSEVTSRSDWCGGNSLSLLIEGSGDREIYSFDDGDGSKAPVLEVTYSTAGIGAGQGCLRRDFDLDVSASENDADENRRGEVAVSNQTLNVGGSSTVGLKYVATGIPQYSVIESASLNFKAKSSASGSISTSIAAENTLSSNAFTSGAANISSRTPSAGPVPWTVGAWVSGGQYQSAELKTLVQSKVNSTLWDKDDSQLTFLISGTGNTVREAHSYNSSPVNSIRLKVRAKYNWGDHPDGVAVNEKVEDIIDNLKLIGNTPIVPSLFEAGLYMTGGSVTAGKMRVYDTAYYGGNSGNKYARVSDPETYTGGTLNQPSGCSSTNLDDSDCEGETISGNATYIKPAAPALQCGVTDAIILLTDGAATENYPAWTDSFSGYQERTPTEYTSFMDGATCADTGRRTELCGIEMASYLNNKKDINVFTIAFGEDVIDADGSCNGYLDKIGAAGTSVDQQGCYTAKSTSDLVDAIRAITGDVYDKGASFSSPSLSVNTFNRLFHRDEVYLSLFKPTNGSRWSGNVKRYGLCEENNLSNCNLGEIIDQQGDPIALSDGLIKTTADSFWDAGVDGDDVIKGGVALELQNQFETSPNSSRKVYAYPTATSPNNVDLAVAAHTVATSNNSITKQSLGDGAMQDQERLNIIKWMLGEDVKDEDGDNLTSDARLIHADPLHSPPVVITYGGDTDTPVSKLVYGTNDGAVRMVNSNNGKEEWAFYPYEVLTKQAQLFDGGGQKVYGVDGEFSVWVNDIAPSGSIAGDGTIKKSESEFVRMYAGMRRGGNAIHAIDLTPSTPLTTADIDDIGDISPTYMWKIEQTATGPFSKLGQTWSKPKIVKLITDVSGSNNNQTFVNKNALIFGGGYDAALDSSIDAATTSGNAIYIVDADTGALIWWMSNDANANINHPEMKYPIASDITVIDSDRNGSVDRLYATDVRGQIFRVDLGDELDSATSNGSPGGSVAERVAVISDLSNTALTQNKRSVFYESDVVFIEDNVYSATSEYSLILTQTGYRPSPLKTGVQDRFYAIRDYITGSLESTDSDGIADTERVLTDTDFADLSTTTITSSNTSTLTSKDGYYFDLPANNKGISKGLTFFDTYFFNVYVPANGASALTCDTNVGESELYAINILTGNGAYEYSSNHGFTKTNDSSVRSTGLKQTGALGAPRGLSLKGGVSLLDGATGGAVDGVDRDYRTFWAEKVEK